MSARTGMTGELGHGSMDRRFFHRTSAEAAFYSVLVEVARA
ncbi:MAG: hypothetical protein ABSG60_03500 [Terracidiphilus sp.]